MAMWRPVTDIVTARDRQGQTGHGGQTGSPGQWSGGGGVVGSHRLWVEAEKMVLCKATSGEMEIDSAGLLRYSSWLVGSECFFFCELDHSNYLLYPENGRALTFRK